MSLGGSFWHRLRMRLGGSDAMLAQISDLVQKQIDANADVQEVTEESILNPIVIAPSKMVLRDNLFKVVSNTVDEGLIAFLPIDPDLVEMRLWMLNDHGGRYLTDHSFMGNKIQLNGSDQSKLIWSTVDDTLEGSTVVNQLIDDQYLRVEDKDASPNSNVRIKEISATATGISVFIRIYVQRNENEANYGKPGVLFSKIDTEQVDFAYGAYLKSDGSIIWFVRDTQREYVLTAPVNSLAFTPVNLPDYTATDYIPSDFHTVGTIEALPDPIPYTDLTFTYQFSNKRMIIYKSQVASATTAIADSNTSPEGSGLVGAWRLVEGGDIGNTPDSPSVFTRFAYNSVTTGNNGTIANATWDTTTVPGAALLRFDGNGDTVDISNYTAINNLSSGTVSLWYYHGGNVSTTRRLIYKNTIAAASSWVIDIGTNGRVTFTARNSSNTAFTTSPTTVLTSNTWYHIVARWTLGTSGKVSINGAHTTGTTPTGTMDTGTTTLRVGDTGTNCANGIIHDVKIWNRNLSDAEVVTVYNAGRSITYLPKWEANPPTAAPPPGPVTNPFVSVYNTGVPAAGEQDLVRLHQITASSLTERYNVGQGAQETPPNVPEQGEYSNDPTYDSGTAAVKALSTYDQLSRTPAVSQYLTINNTGFCGQKFLTGSDVIGKPILEVQAKFADINVNNAAAVGAITCRIVKADHTSVTSATGSVLAESVADNHNGASTSAWTNVTFAFPTNTVNMANGDRIQFEYDQGGTTPSAENPSTYNQLGATLTASSYFSLNKDYLGGMRFFTGSDVIGKPVSKVVVKLCDINPTNAPATGNVVAKIYSGTSLKFTSSTVDASTVTNNLNASSTSNWSTHTFTFSGNTYNMVNGDRINFEYDQNGTAGTPGPETSTSYANVNNRDSYDTIGTASGTFWVGQVIDSSSAVFYNKIVSKVEVACSKSDSSVGPIWAEVVTAGGVIQATSSSVSTSTMALFYPQPYLIVLPFSSPTYAMQIGDYIRIRYNGGGAVEVWCQTPSGQAGTHGFRYENGSNNHFGNAQDECMNVYVKTPGEIKKVGIPLLTSSAEANANAFEAPWTASTTVTDNVNYDLVMDVYILTAGAVRGVGIPYYNTLGESNSNAYTASYSAPTSLTDRSTDDLAADVYIDVKTGAPNHQYTQLRLDGTKFVGEIVSSSSAGIYNKKITKIICRAYKVGSPTGTLFCRLKKASDSSIITFGLDGTAGAGKDVSTLGTATAPAATLTFENDDNGLSTGYATQVGDRIYFEISGGSSTSVNYVQVAKTTTASMVQFMELQTSTDGSTWTTASNDDIIGNMYSGGYTPPPIFPYHTLGYVNSRITQKVTSTTASVGNIYNQRITRVRSWMKRIGSPTGVINCVIRNAADSSVASINTYDASSISNSVFELIPFLNLNQSYTMALNDKISIEFSGGDINNHIQVNTNLLDTYPYGNLETYTTSYTTQAGHDLAGDMHSGGGATDPLARTRVAEVVATTNSTIKLKKISRITVYMKRTVSPTGNVNFRIRNAADAIVATIGTKDAATIDPNTPTAYTITSSPISSYALQVGDKVCVEYNAGDDANFVEVMTSKTTDIFGGTTNTYLSKYDDVNWVVNNSIDLVGQMWEGGDSYTPSQEDVVIPPPKYTKDLHVLAGGSPWTWVNHDLASIDFAPSQLFINAVMPDFRFYRKILTVAELDNIRINRIDRGAIALGQVSKFAYTFINET